MATTTMPPTSATATMTIPSGIDPFGPTKLQQEFMVALAYELRGRLIGMVLSTALFGIFALCTCITILMISRKLRKACWAMWYTFATVAMLASTSIYWVFMLRNTFIIGWAVTSTADGLAPATVWTESCLHNNTSCYGDPGGPPIPGLPGDNVLRLSSHDLPLEYCVGTAALTTNIIIGDAIVLGRVYILWRQSRLIRLILSSLLLGTIAMGVVSTTHSCGGRGSLLVPTAMSPGVGSIVGPSAGTLLGSFFQGDPFGVAASVLSLATNAVSTCLIGWQALKHRALVRGNGLRSYLGRSQVSRAFALLIESGAFYSIIWIFVVAYQFVANPTYTDKRGAHSVSSAFRAFTAGGEAFTEGALVTVIAIYPTIIMLVVALNRSECDIIASYHHHGDRDGTPVVLGRTDAALVFRGSILHSVDFAANGLSVQGRTSTTLSSFSDNENCSRGPVDIPEP